MLKKSRTLVLLLAVLLGLFGLGVLRLFQLRFETGDVYPPYSSLRSDPLGARAFYESLRHLRPLAVERFIQRLDKLREGRDTTLFVLGADTVEMSRSTEEEYKKLEQFMFEGGRIVVSFAPLNARPWASRREEAKDKKKEKRSDKDPVKSDKPEDSGKRRDPVTDDEDGVKLISLKERWNVEFDYQALPKDADDNYRAVMARNRADGDLPDSIVWHTALYFDKPGPTWKVVYSRDSNPVLIERRFGRGALVLSADSYFLSNEAMRKERHPELLAWLVGPNATVLFDETHLGVLEQPGVATLVRHYRLHGLVIGLVLLAGLFVWRNAVSFVPAYAEESAATRDDAVAGKDSAAGFVNLLRRSFSSSEILSVCLAEWTRARTRGRADLAERTERAAAVIAEEQARPARERDSVEGYRRISRILSERK